MIGREFRLPTKEAQEKMSQEEMEKALMLYIEWFLMYEEGMTFAECDKYFTKGMMFQREIEKRFGELHTDRRFCETV